MATVDRTLSKETLSPALTAQRSASRGARMTYSRLIGALFLAGFVVYGVGFGLTSSVIGAPDFLSTISAHQSTLVLGAFLLLLNTPVDSLNCRWDSGSSSRVFSPRPMPRVSSPRPTALTRRLVSRR
jgi:hypothetical protein